MATIKPKQGVYVVNDHEVLVATVLNCNPVLPKPCVAVRLVGEGRILVCHEDQVFTRRRDAEKAVDKY